jgi:hypothetical protein
MQILGAAVLVLVGGALVWWLLADPSAYRAGPWPGLTARGAGMIVGHALLLAAGVLLAQSELPGLPELAWLCGLSLAPLVLATCLVQMPGVASAVCGAYLLPSSLISLLVPSVALPPPLIVPALAFDLVVWLRPSDLRVLWPLRRGVRRKRWRLDRRLQVRRIVLASGLYVLVLALVEPAFRAFSAFSGTGTGS